MVALVAADVNVTEARGCSMDGEVLLAKPSVIVGSSIGFPAAEQYFGAGDRLWHF